jgi:hypothetical protein
MIIYYVADYDYNSNESYYLSGSFFIWFITIFILLPYNLRFLSIVSSVEMKKNKEILEQVIIFQKIIRNELILRIYRQMKMIYRDKFLENKYQALNEFMDSFIDEIFAIHSDNLINVEDLEDVLLMCGIELSDDELRLFAKECMPVFCT